MKLKHHTVASIMLSGILYTIFKSWGLAIASLISGIFVDLDHIIDYLIEYGLPFDMKKFFHVPYERQYQQAFLILHGWEWLFFWGVIASLTDWNPWLTGAVIGYGQHMVLDALYNRSTLRGYSLIWRWKNRFDHEATFPEKNGTNKDI